MAKTIKQYRYFGDYNEENSSEDILKESMDVSGSSNVFLNDDIIQSIGMIVQLGIQGLPGTKIYINQNKSPIILGKTGIFELDLTGYSFVYTLQIDYESAENIETNENGYLIIDAVYDTEV